MIALGDTIAAIATATGGGVGIVRISGPRAEAIARAIVPSLPRGVPSHRMFLGEAREPKSGAVLDEVLAVVMRAPRSYTGEDVAELHGHGGAAGLGALLDAALGAGARLAQPGEFSRRAFLAGKLDLAQVEALVALLAARDARSLRAAQGLRAGALGRKVEDVRRQIVDELAELEGALDFPDEAGPVAPAAEHAARARAIAAGLAALAAGYRRPLGEVPQVLLVGPVNAGKSSLLNALAGEERALVDDAPGTTRDPVEAEVELAAPDRPRVRLVDTAGVRGGAVGIEARGQALGVARRDAAALALLVHDGAIGWDAACEALAGDLDRAGVAFLVVAAKADLARGAAPLRAHVEVSARSGEGIAALATAIARALHGDDEGEQLVATARQAEALAGAAAAAGAAAEALATEAGEVAAVELRRALHELGQLTGETVDERVLDAIFARFCIGK